MCKNANNLKKGDIVEILGTTAYVKENPGTTPLAQIKEIDDRGLVTLTDVHGLREYDKRFTGEDISRCLCSVKKANEGHPLMESYKNQLVKNR